jgi:hypothetical protein
MLQMYSMCLAVIFQFLFLRSVEVGRGGVF